MVKVLVQNKFSYVLTIRKSIEHRGETGSVDEET